MRLSILTIALTLLLSGLSCIFVVDECDSGDQACDGDVAQECRDGEWRDKLDCWDLCLGSCAIDEYGESVCLC